ncbi:MAG: lipoyl(octanoyl) transferase LipB [Rhodospirillales bacterium]
MVAWIVSEAPVAYPDAVSFMERRVAEIRAGAAEECVWLLEHPPLYTAGTSADLADLKTPDRFPVFQSGRGGQLTYHGPGQRVAYVMLDLKRRGPDLRRFVQDLEAWAIAVLADFGLRGERREGRVGIWIDRSASQGPGREDKIAAIGVRVRRWVTFHGMAINHHPDLEHFGGIVPCGIAEPGLGVTSLKDLGVTVGKADLDRVLQARFAEIFEPLTDDRTASTHAYAHGL